MDNRAPDPWLNGSGEIAHPDSPRGGAGPGASRSRRPLGSDFSSDPNDLPPPQSPAARYLTHNDLTGKYLAANDAPKVPADAGTKPQAAPTADAGKPQMNDDDLAKAVADAAEDQIGKPVLGDQCFDLPDQLLRKFGGMSAEDFDHVTGSTKQDYIWGKTSDGSYDIKRGDIAQFRDHLAVITTTTTTVDTFPDGRIETTDNSRNPAVRRQLRGPQHSAFVIGKNDDGTLELSEQHVREQGKISKHVLRGTLYLAGSSPPPTIETSQLPNGATRVVTTTVKIVVTGKVWFYHPKVKQE
jgi:hypothetical protein